VTLTACGGSSSCVRTLDDGRSGKRRDPMTDADQAAAQQVAEELANGRQPLWTQFRLGWRRTYYNMAQALGLKRLQDLLQVLRHPVRFMLSLVRSAQHDGVPSVLQGATSSLSATHPLWILGHEYNLLGKGEASAGETQLDEEASLLSILSVACMLSDCSTYHCALVCTGCR